MIPSIANIRKAIYCLNKRLDLLEGGELSSTITQLSNRIAALESLLDDDLNPTAAIDKFNEIVAFLDSIENTDTLLELLRNIEDNGVMTGSYDATVAVGLADNLRGDAIVSAEFYKRKTGGTQSVGSGIAAIKEVRGKSIVWNQLAYLGRVNNETKKKVRLTKNSDGSLTITADTPVTTTFQFDYYIDYTSGWNYPPHKYYVGATGSSGVGFMIFKNGTGGATNPIFKSPFLLTNLASNDWVSGFKIWVLAGFVGSVTFTPTFIDLTLLFGAGNEPATVAEFEKIFPLNYYNYNAGEVIPFAGQNLTTTGKNQYNPATGKANLLGGQQYQISGTYTKIYPTVSLVDYTYGSPVTSGTYYVNNGNHYVSNNNVAAYDNTKTYTLGSYCINNDTVYKSNVAIETAEEFDSTKWDIIADVAAMVVEDIFTLWDIVPDINGVFTLTKDTEVTIVGGNDTDTMIAIYDGENSAYEPYEKHTLPIDPSQWRDKQGNLVFPYGGMYGARNAYDYAKVDADGYIRKAVRVYERIDLGSLDYSYNSNLKSFASTNKTDFTSISNMICSKYIKGYNLVNTTSWNSVPNKSFNVNISSGNWTIGALLIKDSSYTDATTFKTAMNGVMLYRPLAEPIEVELATPIYAKYLVDKDGTEEITPANGTTPYTTMANLSILYAMDARGEIKNLPKNYLSKESTENMLNAMVSAGVIASYTMTWDAANNRYAFVITAPVEPAQSNE